MALLCIFSNAKPKDSEKEIIQFSKKSGNDSMWKKIVYIIMIINDDCVDDKTFRNLAIESKRLPRTIEFLIEQGGRTSKEIKTWWLLSLQILKWKDYIDICLTAN